MQENAGSESLLQSAEIYGSYFANALGNDNVSKSNEVEETRGIFEDNVG